MASFIPHIKMPSLHLDVFSGDVTRCQFLHLHLLLMCMFSCLDNVSGYRSRFNVRCTWGLYVCEGSYQAPDACSVLFLSGWLPWQSPWGGQPWRFSGPPPRHCSGHWGVQADQPGMTTNHINPCLFFKAHPGLVLLLSPSFLVFLT